MRFFGSKFTSRRATKEPPSVTITSYNLGAGFEERHKLVPIETARRLNARLSYRSPADATEDLGVARPDPLEELACWAAEEALEVRRACPGLPKFSPTESPLLGGAFVKDVEDSMGDGCEETVGEESMSNYSPENSVEAFEVVSSEDSPSSPHSPVDSELEEWMRSQPEIMIAATISEKLMRLEEADRLEMSCHVEDVAEWIDL